MRVKIYQINTDRDPNRMKFLGMEHRKALHLKGEIDPAMYDEVFNAEIKESDPEDIFRRFNSEGHPLYRGHALSVSDVVLTESGAFFCDSIGFRRVPFDETQTRKPGDLMRVVFVEPGERPYEAEIRNRLEWEQKAVGGLIEPIYNGDGTILVGNDEAKLLGMKGNRHLGDGGSIIAGAFFVCGDAGENFRSLTDAETERYMRLFAEPENISDAEVQADSGYILFGFYY